jgi:hypothetical protein
MQAILAVTVPFFALVLCGYVAARQQVLPEAAIPGLNAYVLFFALPCMLFRFGNRTPLFELLNPGLLAVYTLCALAIVFFTLAVTWHGPVHLKDAAFGALVAAFPNSGFMGVPLLVAVLGPSAAGPVMCSLLADMFVTASLCLAIAQAHEASGLGPRRALLRALRGAASNPQPWAIALGAGLALSGLALPPPAEVAVRMLAESASPVALFTIGAVLWRAGQHAHTRTPVALYLPVALIKLLLHPLLVFLAAGAARALGLPISGFQVLVLTLVAALPSASNVSMLAERYGADNGRIARIVMSSTALAFLTFTLLAWAFGVEPRG